MTGSRQCQQAKFVATAVPLACEGKKIGQAKVASERLVFVRSRVLGLFDLIEDAATSIDVDGTAIGQRDAATGTPEKPRPKVRLARTGAVGPRLPPMLKRIRGRKALAPRRRLNSRVQCLWTKAVTSRVAM